MKITRYVCRTVAGLPSTLLCVVLSGNCASSRNGRRGLLFVVRDADLSASVAALIAGSSAPEQ
ncbi:MAG TPA: hypothetical protein VFO44_02815 [Steroidobacteraceae bacterium]|nr:hypothetical protein [Steroidobacteraceae bacterium]